MTGQTGNSVVLLAFRTYIILKKFNRVYSRARVATRLQDSAMSSPAIDQDLLSIFRRTERDSLDWNLETLALEPGCRTLYFLNAHAVTMAEENDAFRAALAGADTVLRDGLGVELAFRRLGLRETANLNGTDLIPKIAHRFRTRKIAVWGSSDEALEKLRAKLEGEGFTNLAPMQHGFHDEGFYVVEFARERPDLVILCMGMPKQEILAPKLTLEGHDALIVCGGGWANFHSGHVKRAPLLMQKMKMEFLHRLWKEPRRLGRRYTIGVAKYFRTIRRLKKSAIGRG